MADNGAVNEAVSYGLRVGILSALMDDQLVAQAKLHALELASAVLAKLDEGLEFDDVVDHLRSPFLKSWLPPMVFDQATTAVLRTLAAAQFIEQEGPFVAVLLHEDVTDSARALAQFGRLKGIPVLHIPHANHFLEPGTDDIHCQVNSDHLGVYGEYMRGWYQACGVPDERIELIGAPQWDELYDTERSPTKEHARRAMGYEQDDFIVAYATTWFQDTGVWGRGNEDLEWAAHRFLQACNKLNAKPCIKLNPAEPDERHKEWMNWMLAYGLSGSISKWHNEFAYAAADVMVVQGPSNLGITAQIAGCPIVEMFIPSARYPEQYGILSTWGDELEDCILAARGAPRNDVFVTAMNFDDDGGAVERAVNWIWKHAGI